MFSKSFYIVFSILCVVAIIVVSTIHSIQLNDKFIISFTIALFFISVLQTSSAKASADASKSAADSANRSLSQTTYVHLASLWYDIKKQGLMSDNFLSPEFTTIYQSEDRFKTYKQYHIYAWACWGHAEDCFINDFHKKDSFLPSIENYKELHYVWLCKPKNRQMFRYDFLKWVENELLIPNVTIKEIPDMGNSNKGVFATKDFGKDDFIGFFEGNSIEKPTEYSVQFGENYHIEPLLKTPFRFLNHSCEPNAYFRGRNLYAINDIKTECQITIDYNCHEYKLHKPFLCKCGTGGCVGSINGYYALNDEQKKIRKEHTAEWLTKIS